MQLARQNSNAPAHAGGTDRKPGRSKKDERAAKIAAIHIVWKNLRPDLRHDVDALRNERLAFMSRVLKRDVTSAAGLSVSKLGKVLDSMRDLEQAPLLPGAVLTGDRRPQTAAEENGLPSPVVGQVVHLATDAQVVTINKLFAHLGWRLEAIEGFLLKRFKVKSHRMLTPAKANSLTMILLTIAASNAIRKRGHEGRVSRKMIGQEIPALKQRLQIDQRPTDDGGPETDDSAYEEVEWR